MGNEIVKVTLDDSHIDDVIELIVGGTHYREIAERYNTSLWSLFKYLHCEKHSARVREAKEYAAHLLVDEAEKVIAQAKLDPRLMTAALALAHHYRWKASMINRKSYADRKVIVNEEQNEDKQLIIRVIRDGDRSK